MTRAQIRAAMMALAKRAETYLPDLNSGDKAKVREARALHEQAMSEFEAYDAQLRAMGTVDAYDANAGDAQFGGLVARGSVAEIVQAVIEQRATTGATAELQSERGVPGNMVPLDLIESRAVTPAPADTGASEAPALMPVFATGDAAFMRIPQRRVPAGDATFPVLTSRPTVHGPDTDSTEHADTTGAFTASTLKPGRLSAQFFWRRTDVARFAGMERALRQALNEGLSEALDAQVVARLVTDNAQVAATAADTFASYRERLVFDRLDGRYATVESDIALLLGSKTYADMEPLVRSQYTDASLIETLRRNGVAMRVSPHVAAVANSKQDVHLRRGAREGDAVVALWDGVSLIYDEITAAKTGEVKLTAIQLAAFRVLRPAGFGRIEVQHA